MDRLDRLGELLRRCPTGTLAYLATRRDERTRCSIYVPNILDLPEATWALSDRARDTLRSSRCGGDPEAGQNKQSHPPRLWTEAIGDGHQGRTSARTPAADVRTLAGEQTRLKVGSV